MSGHLRFGWECPLCSHFAAPTLKTVVRHIGAVHSHDPAFHVRCGVEDCPRTYRNYHTYKKHMYTKHRSLLNLSVTETAREEDISSQLVSNTSQSAEEIIMDDVTSFSEPNVSELEAGCSEHEASEHNSSHQMITDKRKASALFLLKAKEVNKISQSGLNAIIQDFTTLLDQKINSLKVEVSRVLRQRGAEEDICTEILSLFSESWLQNPFNGLDTEFLQQKFYTEAFGLVVSYTIQYYIIICIIIYCFSTETH